MSKNEQEVKEQPKSRIIAPPKSTFSEYFESFVVTLIMAIFGMTFIIQAVTVPTGSMQNTILVGDYLLVNKFIFAPGGKPLPFLPQREIQRGDIVVFKYPGNSLHPEEDRRRNPPTIPYQINYVKRVIGLPGETVEFRGDQVFINGELLPEHRIIADLPTDARGRSNQEAALEVSSEEPRQTDQPYSVYYSQESMDAVKKGESVIDSRMNYGVAGKTMKIPDDSYFCMGDSRDNSEDSRYWGFVNRDLIIGRAMFVYWSCDRGTTDGTMLSCITHPRFDRIGKFIK